MNRINRLITLISLLLVSSSLFGKDDCKQLQVITPEHREKSLQVLYGALESDHEKDKVKAAKYLLSLDYQLTDEELEKYRDKTEGKLEVRLSDKTRELIHLANTGTNEDIPYLLTLLEHSDPNIRIEAANAILRIERRVPHKMLWLSWVVIGLYLTGMVGVGYYYMRRTKSAEDYLLGGGKMKSGFVGLSLFATLLSTITYLAVPGEIIKHGPMLFGQLLAFPVVYFVVGWLFIPFIMRLRVTSAYEILGRRFDNSIRTLSSLLFLSLRLLWMALIIYATADVVLIPLLGLDPGMTPWICIFLGTITLLYTSMGGIRAVVMTDAIQSFILFGGALLVMIMITINLGSIGEWWPKEWAEHWEPARWGFQTEGTRTFGWYFLSVLIWWIATNGSDQMSLQRFLSMRDPKTARKVLGTSLIANTVVLIFLSFLGFTLLAFYRNNPHMLQDGMTVIANADKLLPQFIITSLPAWVTGLVIAGLMAAAMSSLSSGVNSSSAVVTEDFVKRYRKKGLTASGQLKTAKISTVGVGILVVALSSYIYVVPGNLMEVTMRVSNLLTVPLFIMFFMAMFIPWATVFGTWVGTVASIIAAVLIAFWELFFRTPGPSFLYILPGSLLIGIVAGIIASLIPIGQKAKRNWI